MKSKDVKREEAIVRQAARDALGIEGQIKRLDTLYGKGKGAKKERAKLANPNYKYGRRHSLDRT